MLYRILIICCFLLSGCGPAGINKSKTAMDNEGELEAVSTSNEVKDQVYTFWKQFSENMILDVPLVDSPIMKFVEKESIRQKKYSGFSSVTARLKFVPDQMKYCSVDLVVVDEIVKEIILFVAASSDNMKSLVPRLTTLINSDYGPPKPTLTKKNNYEKKYHPTLVWKEDASTTIQLVAQSQHRLSPTDPLLFIKHVPQKEESAITSLDVLSDKECESLFRSVGLNLNALLNPGDADAGNYAASITADEGTGYSQEDYERMTNTLTDLLRQISRSLNIRELAKIRPSIHEDELGARKPPEGALEGKYTFSEGDEDTLVPNTHHLIYYDIIDGIVSDTTLILSGEPGLIDYFRDNVLKSLGKDWRLESRVISNLEKDETVLIFPVLLLRLKDEANVVSLGIQFRKHVKEEMEGITIILRKGPLQQVADILKTTEQVDNELFDKIYRENGLDYENIQSLFSAS